MQLSGSVSSIIKLCNCVNKHQSCKIGTLMNRNYTKLHLLILIIDWNPFKNYGIHNKYWKKFRRILFHDYIQSTHFVLVTWYILCPKNVHEIWITDPVGISSSPRFILLRQEGLLAVLRKGRRDCINIPYNVRAPNAAGGRHSASY
jgi:hypothetical protein